MIQVPELTYQLADEITRVANQQLRTSKQYKQPRLDKIKEIEDAYNGVTKKSLVRENNDTFPFMSGFVDHLYAELDEAPEVEFVHTDEADAKYAKYVTAALKNQKDSSLPNNKWKLKDRWSKKLAIFSGRSIQKYFAQSEPMYNGVLSVIDHYDFHCEPGGGGDLESHLFCGEEGIFKTKEDIELMAEQEYYDPSQVDKLINNTSLADSKDNEDDYNNRLNRHRSIGLDPQTNNYVGQTLFKFVEWYTTYKGVRWYVLFDERTLTWVRIKPLREIFSPLEITGEALYPYISWATHEDPKVFWSKGPCDDALVIHKSVNKLLNQELYNREKVNKGTRLYDPTMVVDVEALADERPDGLIPIDTQKGKRSLSEAMYRVEHGEIRGTLDLVQFLDVYHGQKSGSTPGTQGMAERDKKVGVLFGEMQQLQKRLGVHNKSFREAYEELGLRFMIGLDDHLNGEMPIKIMGAKGIEWKTLTSKELKRNRPVEIKVSGGMEESQRNEILAQRKNQALDAVKTVNPRWKDREILKNAGYTDEDIKIAFSDLDASNEALMSEAAFAIEEIQSGKKVSLNRGANTAFMQKIIDYATDLDISDKAKEEKISVDLYNYAMAHTEIVIQNMHRSAGEMVMRQGMNGALTPEGAQSIQTMDTNASFTRDGAQPPMEQPAIANMVPSYQGAPGENKLTL